MSKKDWRKDYVICEHVAKDQELGQRHKGFRVCCVECDENGFLDKDLDTHMKGKLSIGKIKEAQK